MYYNMSDIYFCGSIAGGREDVAYYKRIVKVLGDYGTVLSEHIANEDLGRTGEDLKPSKIYERDYSWLEDCDWAVAEVSNASHGVGYEIGQLESMDKPVICLYDEDKYVSPMLRGNDYLEFYSYCSEDLESTVEEAIEDIIF